MTNVLSHPNSSPHPLPRPDWNPRTWGDPVQSQGCRPEEGLQTRGPPAALPDPASSHWQSDFLLAASNNYRTVIPGSSGELSTTRMFKMALAVQEDDGDEDLPQHTPQRAELSLQREAGGRSFATG